MLIAFLRRDFANDFVATHNDPGSVVLINTATWRQWKDSQGSYFFTGTCPSADDMRASRLIAIPVEVTSISWALCVVANAGNPDDASILLFDPCAPSSALNSAEHVCRKLLSYLHANATEKVKRKIAGKKVLTPSVWSSSLHIYNEGLANVARTLITFRFLPLNTCGSIVPATIYATSSASSLPTLTQR